jgi:hypothetical protein
MGWRFAFALVATSAWIACGGRTDLGPGIDDDGGTTKDASLDVKPIKDGGKDVTAVDVYQPLGKKCSAPTGSPPPAWTPDDAGAPLHPPYIAPSGGPVIANPAFVAITFNGDENRDAIEDFIDSVGCTDYWRSIVRDYGVNDAYMIGTAHLKDTPPATIDDTQIGAFIRAKIASNELPAPVPNQTLYVIYYPDSTDITLQGLHSCQGFGGYHNEVKISQTQSIPYAVMPNCGSFGQLSGLDALTYATSHELVEAVTDQFPMTDPAYQFPEPDDLAWAFGGGGEIGDMCEFNEDAPLFPGSYPFTVQKQWVGSKAWLMHDPCQPSTQTYFAGAPTMPDLIPIDFGTGPVNTKGVKIAVGSQQTINVTLVADAAWSSQILIDVQDAAFFMGQKGSLTFNVNPKTGNVGDTIQVTIHRVGTSQFGVEPFLINAHSNGITRSWWGLVGDP